jgi:hypothetical protein
MDELRSFSLVRAVPDTSSKKIKIDGGRYLSRSPSGAAKKAFTQAARVHEKCKKNSQTKRRAEDLRMNVTIVETTEGSSGKEYKYTVFRVPNEQLVMSSPNRPAVIYKFQIKALAGLNRPEIF